MSHRLLQAAARKPLDRPPVWIMRQAGRYMPEFRAVRAKHDFLTVCKTPELACEVTLQPLGPIGVDAAIIFSDILIPLEPMGMPVRFDDKGPHLDTPLRQAADVARLVVPSARETVPFLGEAIAMVKRELGDSAPLIGFCGAPWTLAAYMIEGGGSKNYSHIKGFMYNQPEAFASLMDKLVDTLVDYLRLQVESGADIVQIFESWGGVLGPDDFRRFALPWTTRLVRAAKTLGVPVILYMNGCGHVLEELADTGADVLGVDWRLDLGQAFERVGDRVALQGNMDPCKLYAPPEAIEAEVRRLHAQVAGRPGHIFNLGHGILPDVPVAHAQAFVRAVKELPHVSLVH
ncbi:MAG TPA: uroporphyrinogen decarboxylase [Oscillatoriaceae cyanobacterium]